MLLLTAPSVFRLGRRRWSSSQQYYVRGGGSVLLASVYLIDGNLTLLDHLALMRWPEASDVPDAAEISFTSQWTEY